MTIHHATLKRAAQNGIVLTEGSFEDAKFSFQAHWVERNRLVFGNKAPDTLDDAIALKTLTLEYPGLKATQCPAEWLIYTPNSTEVGTNAQPIATASRLRDAMSEALEYCQENDIDPEEEVEEEEVEEEDLEPEEDEFAGSVVAQKYRVAYRERGNANHCSDWLAGVLDGAFKRLIPSDDAKAGHEFDLDAFIQWMHDNGTAPSEKMLALTVTRNRGWQGRFRMTGRQKVQKRIAETGVLHLDGKVIQCPADALAELHEKHPDAYTTYDENRQKANRGR